MNSSLKQLMAQREALELEAEAIVAELTSPGPNGEPPVGIKDPLVDKEGFPRGDIDIYNARQKRSRLSSINVDHREVMKRIEAELALIHSSPLPASSAPSGQREHPPASPEVPLSPIARIDEILAGSPASVAGLKNGDLLLRFGRVDSRTPDVLGAIPQVLRESVGTSLVVLVERPGNPETNLSLTLTPRVWSGRGQLGCHLTPLS